MFKSASSMYHNQLGFCSVSSSSTPENWSKKCQRLDQQNLKQTVVDYFIAVFTKAPVIQTTSQRVPSTSSFINLSQMKPKAELRALFSIFMASGKIILSPITKSSQARNNIFTKCKNTCVRAQITVRFIKRLKQ